MTRFLVELSRAERTRDYRAGILASILANQNRRQGTRSLSPSDFFPSLQEGRGQGKEEMAPDEIKSAFLAAFKESR